MKSNQPFHRPTTLLSILAVALLLAALAPSLAQACRGAGGNPNRMSSGQLRGATLCLINHQRHRHGLGSVHSDRKLRKAATGHSADMVDRDYFSHFTPGGGSIQTRIGGSGYLSGAHSYLFGEIIGGGTAFGGSPRGVVRAWMHSPSHRSEILNGGFHDAGVGVAHGFPGRGSRGATFTIDFGRRG
jgi:uncharacterized protein YkwD